MVKTTSSSSSSSSSPDVTLYIPVFALMTLMSEQVVSDFLPRLKSLFQSKSALENSKFRIEKSFESKLDHQVETVTERDDGKLSREDLEMVMEPLGLFCSPESEELKNSFGSDELSGLFEEEEPSLEEIKQAFDVFDQNKDGFIDAMELKRVLCILGLKEGSEIENCKKMINNCDANRDGKIDFNEFFKFMENIFC
ncbi:probable calcium-binding protein CML46 [Humulus lupulus]|uniref:probable calcium-binding protein CML46 n=1 Tax=Humulus lupulus TaxID=3486 RepID=UPI002B4077BC|nr:probable calcium-binding protein CML46 [Humulus lupulus]